MAATLGFCICLGRRNTSKAAQIVPCWTSNVTAAETETRLIGENGKIENLIWFHCSESDRGRESVGKGVKENSGTRKCKWSCIYPSLCLERRNSRYVTLDVVKIDFSVPHFFNEKCSSLLVERGEKKIFLGGENASGNLITEVKLAKIYHWLVMETGLDTKMNRYGAVQKEKLSRKLGGRQSEHIQLH